MQRLLANNIFFPATESWWQQDTAEKRRVLLLFWDERIVKYNDTSVNSFKDFLKSFFNPLDPDWENTVEKLFSDAIAGFIDFEIFSRRLKDVSPYVAIAMGRMEKFPDTEPSTPEETVTRIEDIDMLNIKRYLTEGNISAVITLGNANDTTLITPRFLGAETLQPFAIHSVGKVFTGILTMLMIHKGIIPESALNQNIVIDASARKRLPVCVQAQLDKATLLQLMTHTGGFGDYMQNYMQAIAAGCNDGKPIPVINQIDDFLPFIADESYPTGASRYSNAGILLLGMAIKHAYNLQFGACSYDDILKQNILDPAGIQSFSANRPGNGKFNPYDPIAQYIAGSPAGGYWMTVEDLARFGQWIYQQCQNDGKLKNVIEAYGQEFYDKNTKIIAHSGGIRSSSAFLSVSLQTGNISAVLSDKPYAAFGIEEHIRRNIYGKTVQYLSKSLV